MKVRLSIWLMLAVVATVIVLTICYRHPALRPRASAQPAPVRSTTSGSVSSATTLAPNVPTLAVGISLPPSVSSAIRMIVDEQVGYPEREQAVHTLSGKLADADREGLYAFLRQHDPGDDAQLGQVLKNDLMDALCRMEPPPTGLRDLLTQIYQDAGQNIVLRDYAVQHLSAFYRQMALALNVDPQIRNDELNQAQQVLWTAVDDTGSSISGTAMLGLSQLALEGWPGLDRDKIGNAALKLAGDSNAGELTRITAFQVCANLNVKDALAFVLGAAQQGETESVRISAIGALGALGGTDQLPCLNGVLQGTDERLKPAARSALNRIEQRLQTARANAGE